MSWQQSWHLGQYCCRNSLACNARSAAATQSCGGCLTEKPNPRRNVAPVLPGVSQLPTNNRQDLAWRATAASLPLVWQHKHDTRKGTKPRHHLQALVTMMLLRLGRLIADGLSGHSMAVSSDTTTISCNSTLSLAPCAHGMKQGIKAAAGANK